MDPSRLTPELVLHAYCVGAFPMAASRQAKRIEWFSPDPRALIPLEAGRFRVRRSLAKRIRSGRFHLTFDRAFEQVIRACAGPRPKSPGTWINRTIIDVFTQLHQAGFAHSVEAWRPGECEGGEMELVGGLYGVALGAAFFGESMFSRETDASKVCLVKLVEHLRERGFELLDVQFTNPHLEQFGVVEVPAERYIEQLEEAVVKPVSW